jgi:protein translocase SecG subunit
MISLLAAGGFLYGLMIVAFVLISLMLIFMVVITPSNEGGMAAAFGGMGSESFFGSKAHSQINKFTVFLAVSFLVLALLINYSSLGAPVASAEDAKTETELKMKELPTPPNPQGVPGLPPIPPPAK